MSKINSIEVDGSLYDIERGMLPEVVNELPATGEEDTMYLIKKDSGSSSDASGTIAQVETVAPSRITLNEIHGDTVQKGTPSLAAPSAVANVTGENTLAVNNKNLIGNELVFPWHLDSYTYIEGGFEIVGNNEAGVHYACISIPNASALWGKTLSISAKQTNISRIGFYSEDGWGAPGTFLANLDPNGQTFVAPLASYRYNGLMLVFYVEDGVTAQVTDLQLELVSPSGSYEERSVTEYKVDLGKNMLDMSTLEPGYINNTGGIGAGADAEMHSDFIKVEPGTAYTFSIHATTDTHPAWFGTGEYLSANESSFVSRKTETNITATSQTFVTGSTTRYIRVSARNLTGATKVQLEKSRTVTSYAPYIRTTNLLDMSTLVAGYPYNDGVVTTDHVNGEMRSGFIKVEPNTTYTFSIQETSTTYENWFGIAEFSEPNLSGFIRRDGNWTLGVAHYTFTTAANCKYVIAAARNLIGATKAQLEVGDTVTPYQLGINGSIELCKIKDYNNNVYEDYIYKNGDDWYLHKAVKKYVIDGIAALGTWLNVGSCIGFYSYGIADTSAVIGAETVLNKALRCDMFSETTTREQIWNGSTEGIKQCGSGGVQYVAFGVPTNKLSDYSTSAKALESVRPWLYSNPVTVYYAALNPSDNKITYQPLIDQLNAINENAETLTGTSNVIFASQLNGTSGPISFSYAPPVDDDSQYDEYIWVDQESRFELVGEQNSLPYNYAETPFDIENGSYLKSLDYVDGGSYGGTGVQQLFMYSSKNMLDMSKLTLGYISSNGNPVTDSSNDEMYSGFIRVKPNTQYTFSIQNTSTNFSKWMSITEYTVPQMYGNGTRTVVTNESSITITTAATTKFVVLSARNLVHATEVQFEEGGAMTPYAKYAGIDANFDFFTESLLDTSTVTPFAGYVRNTGEVVAASNYWSLSIPCDPNTTYIACLDNDTSDRSAKKNVLKLASATALPAAGDTLSDVYVTTDATRGYSVKGTTTNDAQYLVCFFAIASSNYDEAVKRLRIYKASDAIELTPTKRITRDGDTFMYNGAPITNPHLAEQLLNFSNSEASMSGRSVATVYPAYSNNPVSLGIQYWNYYKGDKGDQGSEANIAELDNRLTTVERFVDFDRTVKAVNHRGYCTVAPENTLPAYQLSRKMGFTYVETDVSFTSDGVAVCLHDNTIDRTSDGTGNINDLTYAQVLQYDFGSWKSAEYTGTRIPTLAQFIELCRNLGLKPYVELKSSSTYTSAQIESIVDIVKSYGMEDKTTYISFSLTYLEYVRDYDSKARLGYLADINATNITSANTLKTGTNDVFIDTYYTQATQANVNSCIAAGLPVEVWTVNSGSIINSLNGYVSGVTSDNLIAGKVLYEANID